MSRSRTRRSWGKTPGGGGKGRSGGGGGNGLSGGGETLMSAAQPDKSMKPRKAIIHPLHFCFRFTAFSFSLYEFPPP
jgi:hypothetical protein